MSLSVLTDKIREKISSGGAISGKRVAFDFGTDGCLIVDATIDPPQVSNEMTDSDCVVSLTLDLFSSILSGDKSPEMAFMSGEIQVKGDMSLAMKLGSLLS